MVNIHCILCTLSLIQLFFSFGSVQINHFWCVNLTIKENMYGYLVILMVTVVSCGIHCSASHSKWLKHFYTSTVDYCHLWSFQFYYSHHRHNHRRRHQQHQQLLLKATQVFQIKLRMKNRCLAVCWGFFYACFSISMRCYHESQMAVSKH